MEGKCNHDIQSENTTLLKSPRRMLIHPEIINCYCTVCKRCFKYKKDSDGKLSLVKE